MSTGNSPRSRLWKVYLPRRRTDMFIRNLKSLLLRGFVDAGDGIETSGITDIRQTLGNHPDQEFLIIAQIHIAFGVGG